MWITKERGKKVLDLALPNIGSMVSQNILNLVDTYLVGSLGEAALAAVGVGGFLNFASQALILGLSSGVQALSARRLGEGKHDETAVGLNGGLLISLLMGIPLTLGLYQLAPAIFQAVNDDPQVQEIGIQYYRMRLLAIAAVGMNFSFRGFWNGVSLSKMYMRTILVMHVSNAILSYILIFGKFGFPAMGAAGAGLGTSLSIGIGVGVYTLLAFRHARESGFLKRLPNLSEFSTLLKISLPNSFQQLFFASGLTALYWIIGKVGTTELAAANVLINLTLVALLPSIGLGLAAASLVGQALGRGEPEDAYRWGFDVVQVGLVLLVCLGAPFALFPRFFLGVFLKDPATIEVAVWPLRLIGTTISIEAVGMILMNALLGAGDSRKVMVVSIATQWVYFLPLAFYVGPYRGFGLIGIWIANMSYRALQAVSFLGLWVKGDWKKIEV